jgi:phenylacetate-CoA ligase
VYKEGRQANYAFFERFKRWAGISEKARGVTFAGRVFVSPSATKSPFWRYNYFGNNLQCSSYHLLDKNLLAYYEAMRDFRPDFVDSYPSSIYLLANYIREKNLPRLKVKAVITSAETLLTYQRSIIEQALSCKVFDQYGNAEQAAFICQCEAGSYHVNSEYGIVEFINPLTQMDAKLGEPAELICTGFTNRAMPLIRYRIGDVGILSKKLCPCGREFPVVETISGRLDDFIMTKDGTKIGRLDPVFKGVGETIVESQIAQTDYDALVLRIVRGRNYSESDGFRIREEIHKRTRYQFKIAIEYLDSIPRGRNGKFRAVISQVNNKAKESFAG